MSRYLPIILGKYLVLITSYILPRYLLCHICDLFAVELLRAPGCCAGCYAASCSYPNLLQEWQQQRENNTTYAAAGGWEVEVHYPSGPAGRHDLIRHDGACTILRLSVRDPCIMYLRLDFLHCVSFHPRADGTQ